MGILGPGCHVGPDCGVGTGAELGPGVMLLDRTRLPGKASPATVGAGAKVGGGAVIAGVKVGEGAYVAAGEPKRFVRTSRGTWRTLFPMERCGWADGCQRSSTGRRGTSGRSGTGRVTRPEGQGPCPGKGGACLGADRAAARDGIHLNKKYISEDFELYRSHPCSITPGNRWQG